MEKINKEKGNSGRDDIYSTHRRTVRFDPASYSSPSSWGTIIIVLICLLYLYNNYQGTHDSKDLPANTPMDQKSAAYQVAVDNAKAQKEAYYSQFDWYNDEFGVINDSSESSYGMVTINGRVIPLKKGYDFVQINYGIYSSNGNKVGDAIASMNNLAKGTTWQFQAVGTASIEGSLNYRVESISGW